MRGDKGKSLMNQEPSPQHMETGAAEMVAKRDFWRSLSSSGPDPEVFLIQNP